MSKKRPVNDIVENATDEGQEHTKAEKKRSARQNRALWLLYTLLAHELNDSGLDQRKVLKETVDIPWTKEAVHDQLWVPIQNAMFNKQSTTELTTKEIDEVFDTLNRHLGEKLGLHVNFPSIQDIIIKQMFEK